MAGIYIHIPFCKQACSYCNFHFSTALKRKAEIVDAICQEAKQRQAYLEDEPVETIYFGGGTPSLLSSEELKKILHDLKQLFNIAQEVEVTLEANPEDLNEDKLRALKEGGVNRLSIGVQSFHQKDLSFFNRAHNAEQAEKCILLAQDCGFENMTIDLIFGAQTTSDQAWQENLEKLYALRVPHFSAYSLTLEEKTALNHLVKTSKTTKVDEEKNWRQYELLLSTLTEHNYEQYELSNYGKTKTISKHNSAYWFGKKYLGLGPSAHSFNGSSRQWNVANNLKYIKALKAREKYFELESLNEVDQYHELLITRLRTKWGISIKELNQRFSENIVQHFNRQLAKLNKEWLVKDSEYLKLTPSSLFQSDEVVRKLMI